MSERLERREFLRGAGLGAAVGSLALAGCGRPVDEADLPAAPAASPWWLRPSRAVGEHQLPDLPYPKDQLTLKIAGQPAVKGLSAQVVEWHHDKHHAGYVTALNQIERELAELPPDEVNANYSVFTELKRRETFNASGMYLHELYWRNLTPGGVALSPTADVARKLTLDFGDLDRWRADFVATAKTANTGWAILALCPWDGRLHNFACSFHDLGGVWGAIPLLALDVWEHAYYYDYGPDRGSYIESFLRLLDWGWVDREFLRWARSGVIA